MRVKLTATLVALAIAVTPALVRAASLCRCADHATGHAAPAPRPCCHGDAPAGVDAPRPAADACARQLTRGACCAGNWSALLRGPATLELRLSPVDPPAAVGLPARPDTTSSDPSRPARATRLLTRTRPAALPLLHCALLR